MVTYFFVNLAFVGDRYLHEKDVIFPRSHESWRRTQADRLKRLRCKNAWSFAGVSAEAIYTNKIFFWVYPP